MVEIQKELCIGCGACVNDCPGGALKLEEGKANAVRRCIQCGHCVAVCPVKAVSIPEYDMDEVEEFKKEAFVLNPETFLHAVKFRRSIRDFTDRKADRRTMEDILNAGRYTATAKNVRGNTFVVVQEQLSEFKALVWQELPGIIQVLEEHNPSYAKAFSYFYRKWERDHSQDNLFFKCTAFLAIGSETLLDGGLAAANMENMAVAKGMGVLYSGYLQGIISASPVLTKWLGLEEKKLSCCMLLGYPAVKYRRTAPRKKADIRWK